MISKFNFQKPFILLFHLHHIPQSPPKKCINFLYETNIFLHFQVLQTLANNPDTGFDIICLNFLNAFFEEKQLLVEDVHIQNEILRLQIQAFCCDFKAAFEALENSVFVFLEIIIDLNWLITIFAL